MKEGTRHWLLARLSALPLIPLFFYFIFQAEYLATRSRMVFISWLKQPEAMIAVIVFILCAFYHGCRGVDEIIEDYISPKSGKAAVMLANKLFFLALGAASLYATWAIYSGKF